MSGDNLRRRVEALELQVAQIQSSLRTSKERNWRRAVDKYTGDKDLLAALAEGRKLREAERKVVRRVRARRSEL